MEGDKRAHPRYLFSESVEFSFSNMTVNGGIAGNISVGGICLKVQGFVPKGTILELQLRLGKNARVIWVMAQVRRVREISSEGSYEIGLEFLKDLECETAIGKYIDACQSKQTEKN